MSLLKVVYDKDSEFLVRQVFGLEEKTEESKVWGYIREEGQVKELVSVIDLLTVVDKV